MTPNWPLPGSKGSPSWARFKAFIVEARLDFHRLTARFVEAAVSDWQRAEAILAAHPKIRDAGFYVALVLGDWNLVEHPLADLPTMVNEKGGPRTCVLFFMCAFPDMPIAGPTGPGTWPKPRESFCAMAPIPTPHSYLRICPTIRFPACMVQPASTTTLHSL